jgi:adenosylhomocysteine nucleosidase
MLPAPRVLVCFAVRAEASHFTERGPSGVAVQTLITGIGRENAVRALESALDPSRPDLVLTCGFAGGLRPDLPVGTVVYHEDEGAALGPILSSLGAVPTVFHCSARIATTSLEKQQLRDETGADAVEMESEAIRQLCRERRVSSATIRVISDSVAEDLPVDFNALMNDRCQLQYQKLGWLLLKSPGRIPRLLRLQRHTRTAAKSLGSILQELLRRKWGSGR